VLVLVMHRLKNNHSLLNENYCRALLKLIPVKYSDWKEDEG
jgi:hypothetical protein